MRSEEIFAFKENKILPIKVTGVPYCKADMAVHFPVPFQKKKKKEKREYKNAEIFELFRKQELRHKIILPFKYKSF